MRVNIRQARTAKPAPSPRRSSGPRMEERESFEAFMPRAVAAGAAGALLVWIAWAICALLATHLEGGRLAALAAQAAGWGQAGSLLQGGGGLSAGSIPIFPTVAISLSLLGAAALLAARKEGKVPVVGLNRSGWHEGPGAPLPHGYLPSCARHSTSSPVALVLGCAIGGVAAGAIPFLLPAHPALTVLAAGAILAVVLTRRPVIGAGRRARAAAVAGCGLTTVVGVATVEAIASQGWLETLLPAPLPLMIQGGILGGFMMLGTALAHVSVPVDEVGARYREKAAGLRGELLGVARRAHDTYRATAEMLDARAAGRAEALRLRERLASVTIRVIDLARQCQAVSAAAGEETELRLGREIAALDRKIGASEDPVARRQYERARATLATQQEQLDRIRLGRERALATIHGQLAQLERARLSLIGLESSDSGLLMAELEVVSESLDESSAAMDAESEAMLEVATKVCR